MLDSNTLPHDPLPLRQYVEQAIRQYLDTVAEEDISDLYHLIINEVEAPLLAVVLEKTAGNQSKSAQMLGLNRGTLRTKLKQHQLL